MNRLEIYGTPVGPGAPCYIIAEAGSNHNGELAMARELVEVAAAAGSNAVKFQTFKAKRLYPKSAGKSDYLGVDTSIYDIIKAMEMPEAWLGELSELAHSLGLAFISSPFHEEAVALLDPYVDAFKIASYELTHAPLLRAVAARNKPIIMSTGASTFSEVRDAVALLRELGCDNPVVLQCTASYPAPLESVQVRALVDMRERLGVMTGLSDHTEHPALAATVAASLGASLVEKHFTLSKALPGPDHAFAIEPAGLKALVEGVRGAEIARGHGRKEVHPVEAELRQFARRSIFAIQPVKAGEILTRDNTDILRQGKLGSGLQPRHLSSVLGATAARDIAEDTPLQAEDITDGAAIFVEDDSATTRLPALHLRPAEERDLGLVWVWANDPMTRVVSLNSDPIPYAGHAHWFRSSLASTERSLFIAERSGDPVAVVRLDHSGGQDAEISIHVAPTVRGQGVGRASLLAATDAARALGLERIIAVIRPGNASSRRTFEAVGYALVGPRNEQGVDVNAFMLSL